MQGNKYAELHDLSIIYSQPKTATGVVCHFIQNLYIMNQVTDHSTST